MISHIDFKGRNYNFSFVGRNASITKGRDRITCTPSLILELMEKLEPELYRDYLNGNFHKGNMRQPQKKIKGLVYIYMYWRDRQIHLGRIGNVAGTLVDAANKPFTFDSFMLKLDPRDPMELVHANLAWQLLQYRMRVNILQKPCAT